MMLNSMTTLLDFSSITKDHLEFLFNYAEKTKEEKGAITGLGQSIALLFFEPSTRTRLSFQTAAYRIGLGALVLEANGGNSLEKGETPEDTVLNVAALQPRIIVVRCGNAVDLNALSKVTKIPILNAGWGTRAHPTQALSDMFTLLGRWGSLKDKRLLFVGDAKHSRVVASHLKIFQLLGMHVGFAGPESLLPEEFPGEHFMDLSKALKWCDAVMSLRFQFERHLDSKISQAEHLKEYSAKWGLTCVQAKNLRADCFIMHPGPVNWGIEIEAELSQDPRSLILEQVRNGVWMREALLRIALGEGI
jgi:aspartate carbamoyltransferase catalytic subunit